MQIQVNNQQFDDKEILNDALISQKALTSDYNSFANECATPAVMDEFMYILSDEHQIQHEIFQELQKRGWYPTTAAEATKIDQTKTKFAGQGAAY